MTIEFLSSRFIFSLLRVENEFLATEISPVAGGVTGME